LSVSPVYMRCVAVCCSVLQYVAVRQRTLQRVAARCSVWQCVAVCCSIQRCGYYNTLQHTATHCNTLQHTTTHTQSFLAQQFIDKFTCSDNFGQFPRVQKLPYVRKLSNLLTDSLIRKLSQQITNRLTCWDKCCSEITAEWRRPTEFLMLQVIFRKRATNYRGFVRKMTYKDRSLVRTCCQHDSGPFSREKLE